MTEMTIGWAIVISCDSTCAFAAGTEAEDKTVVVAKIPNRIVVIFIVFLLNCLFFECISITQNNI